MEKLLSLFLPNSVSAVFLIPDTNKNAFDYDMELCSATVLTRISPEQRSANFGKPDVSWGIETENAPTKFISKYKSIGFTLQYSDGIRAEFHIRRNVITYVEILLKDSKGLWRNHIAINNYSPNLKNVESYYIGYSSNSKCSSDDIKEIALALNLAAQVMDELRGNVEPVTTAKQTLLGRLWKLFERFNGKINDEGKVTHGVFFGENIKRVFFRKQKK